MQFKRSILQDVSFYIEMALTIRVLQINQSIAVIIFPVVTNFLCKAAIAYQ